MLSNKLYQFIKPYLSMEINGRVINCPYWMNKIRGGRIVRGFGNGKANATEIRERLQEAFDGSDLHLLAKRGRIGIDCSGFVYRVLNYFVKSLDDVFPGGINKTNAVRLTNGKYSLLIDKIDNIRAGDLIRMRGGKHIAIIIEKNDDKIIYAHSSSKYTVSQGVHLGEIKIVDPQKPLEQQLWQEKLRNDNDFQSIYYNPQIGDGVYRLKVMAK